MLLEFLEVWTLSPTGNWSQYQVDAMADDDYTDAEDLNQTRSHNLVNEIGTIGEGGNQMPWADPGYDARGNMTTVPAPSCMPTTYTATYDSWNRLIEVKSGGTTVRECVSCARYIDAAMLRDRNTDAAGRWTPIHRGGLCDDERLYCLHTRPR